MGALSQTKVVEMGSFAPLRLATRWLALLGAEVISIERPRSERPGAFALLDDDAHPHWTAYQANKLSITLNLKTPEGQEAFHRLIRDVDVFAEGHRPGTLDKLKADYAALSKVNPRLVYCSVTGFGQTGPYSGLFGHEPNYQGMSGVAGLSGHVGGPPELSAFSAGDRMGGSAMAAIGIMAALLERQQSGKGQHVDVSCAIGLMASMGRRFADELWTSGKLSPRGLFNNWDGHAGYGLYETKDAQYVAISAIEPWSWERFCKAVGREDLAKRTHLSDGSIDLTTRDEIAEVFRSRTREEWWKLNIESNLGITPVLEPEEVINDPHMNEWGAFTEVDHPRVGKIKQTALPFKLSRTPGDVHSMPLFGQHTEELLTRLGYSSADTQRLRSAGAIE